MVSNSVLPPSLTLQHLWPEEDTKERIERDSDIAQTITGPIWSPQKGQQDKAYNSDADVIGYGGAAGGGKSFLGLGLAATKHHRSIIFRRVFPSVRGLIE